jgi:hypothetical protein
MAATVVSAAPGVAGSDPLAKNPEFADQPVRIQYPSLVACPRIAIVARARLIELDFLSI